MVSKTVQPGSSPGLPALSQLEKSDWKDLSDQLFRAACTLYCACGENSAHDPADLCLRCYLEGAIQRIQEANVLGG